MPIVSDSALAVHTYRNAHQAARLPDSASQTPAPVSSVSTGLLYFGQNALSSEWESVLPYVLCLGDPHAGEQNIEAHEPSTFDNRLNASAQNGAFHFSGLEGATKAKFLM